MTNREKYIEVFLNTFQVGEQEVSDLEYQGYSRWDSVGHMNLISELEDVFDIMLDTEDIIEFSSYEKGVEILKRYNVEI